VSSHHLALTGWVWGQESVMNGRRVAIGWTSGKWRGAVPEVQEWGQTHALMLAMTPSKCVRALAYSPWSACSRATLSSDAILPRSAIAPRPAAGLGLLPKIARS
jgi:hypothetical protein